MCIPSLRRVWCILFETISQKRLDSGSSLAFVLILSLHLSHLDIVRSISSPSDVSPVILRLSTYNTFRVGFCLRLDGTNSSEIHICSGSIRSSRSIVTHRGAEVPAFHFSSMPIVNCSFVLYDFVKINN